MLDNVTINQLRTFVSVCDEGSFSGAAQALSRAQSAVSHAISALERALDVELFLRDKRRAELSAAGRNLLPDARAVIARTEEMKTRARSIIETGAPRISIAVDVYFPRKQLISSLQTLRREIPNAFINLRMTTMQNGEALVLDGSCAFAITVSDVPELKPSAIERQWLSETQMVTVCAPYHPLTETAGPVPLDEFNRHAQIVVTDNQSGAEKSLVGVAGERRWLVNDLSVKHDFLLAGLGWGHMPIDLVRDDIASGKLTQIQRRAWHIKSLVFMVSQPRGRELLKSEARLVELLASRKVIAG